MVNYKKTKKLVKVILNELNQQPSTLEALKQITLKYFAKNIFTVYELNNQIKTVTYEQMFEQANIVRNNLLVKYSHESGVIVLQMDNSPNWYIAFWGIVSAGFKPILVDPKINILNQILQNLNIITTITDSNIQDFLLNKNNQPTISYAEEIAFLSSGTTGTPKIISYNASSLKAQIGVASNILKKNKTIRLGNKLTDANKIRILAFLPFFHIFGFMVIVVWFSFFGRTIIFLKSLSSKDIQLICQKYHVTHFFAVPLVWENIVNAIFNEAKKLNKMHQLQKAIKLSNFLQNISPTIGIKIARSFLFGKVRKRVLGNSLQFCISGGAQINKKYLQCLNGIGYSIHNGYGLTESGIVSVELSKYARYRNRETVGKPFNIVQWKITPQNELQIKGPLLFQSTLLHGKLIINNQNEWYSTNDIIKIKKKRIQVVGRLDDAIIGGDGENVHPEELENLINIDNRYTCGILGIKQRSGCHQINLLVYFKEHLPSTEQLNLIEKIHKIVETIPIYKRPIKFYATDQLPLTNLGKVKHKQLLLMYQNHELKLVPLTKNIESDLEIIKNDYVKKLLDDVRQCFAKIFNVNVNTIYDNTNFMTDLGGSSIDYYGLLNEITQISKKEIKLVGNKALLTPLDFVIYILNN
ncbi:MAG: AMP-binding protein [Mycoplasmataceae bacterium]|nr:AMP-binding protein [Mycoplasmataceae bacterium]